MPKLLPELKTSILQAARQSLLKSERHDIAMREVARLCGTAVGTIYNYFPSKEALMAEAMMDDWLACLDGMREGALSGRVPMDSLRAIVCSLRRFATLYGTLWKQHAHTPSSPASLEAYHRRVIEAIGVAVKDMLVRFDLLYDSCLPDVLSELVLMASRTEDGFDRIAPVLERILC